ncbi:SusD/RagB family nutrient-binding outer membrane lipoprotein [Marinigracilibium pacificum]|uniref:SusD/RagB family nutrient-binding outer membrane lipoprotein n=1 Tax=Marinigracilibium pacificum TaxID=2729599 RepID=A0A848IW19_9BACT|nr:SusD/RagB family nutrient-binding outer membrane lipoprotein [Marinigracilibium pacificum]NMM47368.1 SusD/RagB family nutrient-binding outer membrane lipoprotein [Marinigracilibium pacificum]
MKNNLSYINKGILMGFMVLLFFSCDDITDLNENPNNPIDVPSEFLLPSAIVQGTYYMGGSFNRATSFWVQHWATTGTQYQRLDRYDVDLNTFNTDWAQLYAGALTDLSIIIEKSRELPNYRAQARILYVYYYQMITDVWGDVPYTEALKGQQGNITPVYDNQLVVYDSLINQLDKALSEIDLDDQAITDEDVLLGGDMEMWQKFGNSLKLRLYLRLSEVDENKAQQGFQEVFNGGATLLGSGENVELIFGERTATNANPLFQQEFQRPTDYGASSTFVAFMEQYNDPRIAAYLRQNQNDAYSGVDNGNPDDLPTDGDGNVIVSRIGDVYVQEDSPIPLMTYYDVKFMEAEANIRGWVNTGDAKQLYEEAVKASFDYYGVNIGTYLDAGQPAAYDNATALEDLMLQRYFSLFARGTEAWSEWRRTNIPSIDVPADAIKTATPLRFPYVDAEITNNPDNAELVEVTIPVAWDVN